MILEVQETPLQFIVVTSLSNKCYSYHLWLLVIKKSGKNKKINKFSRLQIEVFFLPNLRRPHRIQAYQICPLSVYMSSFYLKRFYHWERSMFLYFGACKCFYLVRNKQFLHLGGSNVSVWSGASRFLYLVQLLS